MMGNKDATDAAFADAKHVVSLKVHNTRITANSIEPRAAIGQYHPDGDNYTLYSTSQNPHGTRSAVAGQVLKVPETKLRVISPDVGGGFGMKHGGYPEDALVVWASRRVGGRPVKWVSTRSEALLGDSQGRDQVVTGELALDERGKILGHARQCAACHGLARVRRLDGGAAVRDAARARRLSDPGGACVRQGRPHQHHSARALSRRRPAGGDLSDRAIARPRRARHRHRSDRDQAAQFHSGRRHAAQDRHRHHL